MFVACKVINEAGAYTTSDVVTLTVHPDVPSWLLSQASGSDIRAAGAYMLPPELLTRSSALFVIQWEEPKTNVSNFSLR